MNTKRVFFNISGHVADYKNSVDSAFRTYKSKSNQARELYSEKVFAAQDESLRRDQAAAIDAAKKNLKTQIAAQILELRKQYNEWINEPVQPAFIEHMRIIHDFDLPITGDDMPALLAATYSNPTALMVLQKEAARCGISVKVPILENARKDLQRLEQLPRMLENYAPDDCTTEAAHLFGVPAYQVVYSRMSADDLQEISNRWDSVVSGVTFENPGLTDQEKEEAQREQDARINAALDRVQVETEAGSAEAQAKKIGRAKASTAKGIENYIVNT